MDFAPYQDSSPSDTRARSPSPPPSRTASPSQRAPPVSRTIDSTIHSSSDQQRLPPPSHYDNDDDVEGGYQTGSGGYGGGGEAAGGRTGRTYVDLFETSLPLRLDYEAMLAYLLLPPAGGLLLLVLEHKSDYVRFHAWQSSLVFAFMFVLHLVFTTVKVVSYMLLAVDLCLIGFLTFRAYKDVDTLDRFEMPLFGRFASRFVDSE